MSILELKRSKLEELEVIENAISERLQRNPGLFVGSTSAIDHGILNANKKRPIKEVLIQKNEIDLFIKRFKSLGSELQSLNDVKSSAFKQEIDQWRDPKFNFQMFDKQYNNIKESQNNATTTLSDLYSMGGATVVENTVQDSEVASLPEIPRAKDDEVYVKKSILSKFGADIKVDKIFSLEEQYGKFLDLIHFHEIWLNLPGLLESNRLTYLEYLSIFSRLGLKYKQDEMNPNNTIDRTTQQYFDYCKSLAEYLITFVKKIQVLQGPERIINKIKNIDFTSEWESLIDKYINKQATKSDDGLFCKACNKSFAKETVFNAHLTGKKHIKNEKKLQQTGENNNGTSNGIDLVREKELCFNEFMIRSLADFLEKEIKNTRMNVERKQALTNKERLEETRFLLAKVDNDDFPVDLADGNDADNNKNGGADSDNDDDESVKESNPLNLPLDVDGSPIPYWLYKLQGLDHQYQCEVCGNLKFHGRKNYEKHFMESRHIHGLKCLGVNISGGNASYEKKNDFHNSSSSNDTEVLLSFKGITKIDEVTALWNKMKKEIRKKESTFDTENIVEVEDEDGNVMSEKVYQDLKKQGLL
ncbi:SF3a splicing factor complex subunit [Saccharomycopsis crataegensis]|uniref:SF3a splicing factor complex subunit n=1 Tax=Saccharomycopsis crataegensis TaxID=43959 RepID=A0AAV5QN53_9ASCO|nr:SF3a splicing factor complex subunit [Saccharomycopsis crataegensis]